jgi:hypothetical protein
VILVAASFIAAQRSVNAMKPIRALRSDMSRSKFATVFVVGVSVATLSALSMPIAQAQPECTNTNQTTTQCQHPGGSVQINTVPNPALVQTYQWPWWDQQQVIVGGFGFGGFGRR